MGVSVNELNIVSITSDVFSREVVEKANKLANLTKEERKAKALEIKELKSTLKAEYDAKDIALKSSIKEKEEQIKLEYEADVKEIEDTESDSLTKAAAKHKEFADETEKAYSDVVKGIQIVAKRAKIKAKTNRDEKLKAARIERYDLIAEYQNIIRAVGSIVSPVINLKTSLIESHANLNLVHTLTSRKTWIGLVPLFMLILIIAAYFIGRSVTGYQGNLGDVINNGIFVAVVATGAVYIYSQGGFDMSLGAVSLMCATVAAIVWNKTGNLALTLGLAVVIGAGLGIINAILATMLNLPVMVMTLTMMNILGAINEELLGSLMRPNGGLPTNAWVYASILLLFFIFCWLIFNYTKVGRRNKFIGSNKTAARFNGINLMQAGIISFGISGIGLGLCGFIFVCTKSDGGNFGTNTVLGQVGLNVVIAIIFGGMTTSGGPKSKISCAVIGAFFSVFLDEFFAAISTPTFAVGDYCYMVKGIIFIIVALANMWDTRGKMLASGGSIQ